MGFYDNLAGQYGQDAGWAKQMKQHYGGGMGFNPNKRQAARQEIRGMFGEGGFQQPDWWQGQPQPQPGGPEMGPGFAEGEPAPGGNLPPPQQGGKVPYDLDQVLAGLEGTRPEDIDWSQFGSYEDAMAVLQQMQGIGGSLGSHLGSMELVQQPDPVTGEMRWGWQPVEQTATRQAGVYQTDPEQFSEIYEKNKALYEEQEQARQAGIMQMLTEMGYSPEQMEAMQQAFAEQWVDPTTGEPVPPGTPGGEPVPPEGGGQPGPAPPGGGGTSGQWGPGGQWIPGEAAANPYKKASRQLYKQTMKQWRNANAAQKMQMLRSMGIDANLNNIHNPMIMGDIERWAMQQAAQQFPQYAGGGGYQGMFGSMGVGYGGIPGQGGGGVDQGAGWGGPEATGFVEGTVGSPEYGGMSEDQDAGPGTDGAPT